MAIHEWLLMIATSILWSLKALTAVIVTLVAVLVARILAGQACDWIYNRFIRAAKQVRCSVFIKSEVPFRGDYVGTFWLPSVPRIGEKLIVPELKNPHDDTTHVMNGWLGARVRDIEYAVEGGGPWHTNVHVECDEANVHD